MSNGPTLDRKKANEAQIKHFEKEMANIQDYKRVFGSEQGRRVLADLMTQFYMYQTTFTAQPHEVMLREGGRNTVMYILAKLETHPEKIRDIIREKLNG